MPHWNSPSKSAPIFFFLMSTWIVQVKQLRRARSRQTSCYFYLIYVLFFYSDKKRLALAFFSSYLFWDIITLLTQLPLRVREPVSVVTKPSHLTSSAAIPNHARHNEHYLPTNAFAFHWSLSHRPVCGLYTYTFPTYLYTYTSIYTYIPYLPYIYLHLYLYYI